jgi:surface antigen
MQSRAWRDMSLRLKRFSAAVALLSVVAACAPPEGPEGMAPAAGPLLDGGGGRIQGRVADTLVSGFVGRGLGRQLDTGDIERSQTAQQRAYMAPVGEPVTWANPDNGHRGTMTALRDGRDAAGRACREYRLTLTIGGNSETAYGTACREADGAWAIVNN